MAEQVFYISGDTGSTVVWVGLARVVNFNTLDVPGGGTITVYDADRINDTTRPIASVNVSVLSTTFSLDVNLPCYRGIMVVESSVSGGYVALVYEDDPDLEWGDRGYPA